jgi:CMP-N-acetylneuraminic acid synthetase
MGSQRLKYKNLQDFGGVPLITWAICKSISANVFDEIWVNSEHPLFGMIATNEGVRFHKRPPELASDIATSEDYVYEFLMSHLCDYVFQVHTIAPLLTAEQVSDFVNTMINSDYDVLLSVVNEQIECVIDGIPINFSFDHKTNSQELTPIQRITWSITGWKASTYIAAYQGGECATYTGKVGFYPIDHMAGYIIKTEEDLLYANRESK